MNAYRAWKDALRFHLVGTEEKNITFYAEEAASWCHFEGLIRELTEIHGRAVHYLTSDANDPLLESPPPQVEVFYIGAGWARTFTFMALRTRLLVMTTPDLETFHLKRSRLHPVHYVYVFHSMVSSHMIYRPRAFDHFDTVFCVGEHHVKEIRAREQQLSLPAKHLVHHGYGRFDQLRQEQLERLGEPLSQVAKHVLIAPSWGPHGLLETCGASLVDLLLAHGWSVAVRPHPMTVRREPGMIRELEQRFLGRPEFRLDLDLRNAPSILEAPCLISDWSGAALEYAFATGRPVLFVDVPRKVNNPDYSELGLEPIEVAVREQLGVVVAPHRLREVVLRLEELQTLAPMYVGSIRDVCKSTVFHPGSSAAVGARMLTEIADGLASVPAPLLTGGKSSPSPRN